jgi:O-antigen/teichoic acid export membrane protein
LIVCIFSIFSSEFVSILANNDYLDSSKYVGGLTLFFALYIVKECIDIGPKITEKTKFLSYNFVVSLLVNFITLYLFTNAFELKGVVFAMISTNLVLVLVSWFTSSRLYPINFDKLYFLILFLPALIIAIVSMFINIYLGYKLLICFAILLFYGLFFYKSYKQIKKLI